MDKKTAKRVAIATAIGFGTGFALAACYYAKGGPLILKAAEWTPQGDMLLSFYHRENSILIPNPKVS